MKKMNGTSLATRTRSTQQALVPIELQKQDSGKLQGETKQFTVNIFLLEWERLLCFTEEEHPMDKNLTGSCMSIGYKPMKMELLR